MLTIAVKLWPGGDRRIKVDVHEGHNWFSQLVLAYEALIAHTFLDLLAPHPDDNLNPVSGLD